MEYVDFLAEKFNGLSEKAKGRVSAYFPAIAGSKLASMSPIKGVNIPANNVCKGIDIYSYAQCLTDAIVLAEFGGVGNPTLCYGNSNNLAKMLGIFSVIGDFQVVLRNIGFQGFEVTSEDYNGWDDEDPEDHWSEEEEGEQDYEKVTYKSVPDSQGFITDYTWYKMSDGRHVFILGDNEVYTPENTYFDHECESEREAQEWFDSYGEDEEEEDVYPPTEDKDFQDSEAVEEDVEEPAEVDDSADEEPHKVEDLDKEIGACFASTINNYVSKILNIYDLMFSSGFDLRRPYGVLGEEGVYYVDKDNHCAVRSGTDDMDFSTSIKMYSLFQGKLGFNEKPCRSTGVIGMEIVNQYISNPSTVMYFPQKCLEIMYGRVPATAKKELNGEKIVYFSRSENSNSWSAYRDKDIKEHLHKLLVVSVRVYIERTGISDKIRTIETVNKVNGLLEYTVSCLTSGVLVIDYKTANGSPVKFKVRVSDPTGKLSPNVDYAPEIISVAFSGNAGGKDSKKLRGGLDADMSARFRVYEYAHEFNHTLSNAMPLFAYRALETLLARGDKVSWKNAIIGQSMDDTILKNGSGGINMSNALFHHINAGSRSGKGVMTLNMLASSIASGRPIFYLDNKVDMGSLLANLAHGGGGKETSGLSANGPHTFVVNGSNFEKDDFCEFVHRNNWVIQEHIPQEVRSLFGSSSWDVLGELFYLRAYMLCLGIVFARGSDSNGKAKDPMFGGEEGIMVVVDEINQVQARMLANASLMADVVPPLDSEYQNRVDLIKAAAGNEKEMAKLPKLLRSFRRQFNGSAYYALSLLKSYADCIQSIKNKSFSGFKDKEANASDIFIIGQNLEPIPIGDLGDVLKTSRYKNDSDVGLNKMANGGNKVRTQSIPYQMTLFKSADAFIGYNGPQPQYLMQTDEKSKAFGVLDMTAKGFAYVPAFSMPADGEKPANQFCSMSKANDSRTVYFKPYLILNHGDRTIGTYVADTLGYCEKNGVSNAQVIAEYPDNDPNYKDINRNVGFANYMAMMGMTDLSACLKKSADIADHVVSRYLGYTGMAGSPIPLWLQFVTDLRVEWMFSPQDVWAKCTGNAEYNLGKGIKSKVTGEYYQYVKDLAELQLMGVDVSDPTVTPSAVGGGDGNYSASDAEDFEIKAGLRSSEDGSNATAEESAERERLADAMGDFSDLDGDIFGDYDDDDSYENELESVRSGMSAFNFTASNAAGSYREQDIGSVGYTTVSESISNVDMDAVEAALAVLKSNGYNVNIDMCGYSVGSDGKMVTNYEPATEQRDMGDLFDTADGVIDSDEEFQRLVNGITARVIKDYGGLGRVRSFGVIGDSLVINGTMYRCKINEDVANRLYVDLRREVNAGNICRLFNYKMLAGMTELSELRCDSASFMYEYINYGAFGSSDVPLRAYFDAFPKLRLVQIGKERYTRDTIYAEDAKEPYYIQSKTSKFFDNVHAGSKKWNQGAWSWGKSKLTDKKSKWYQKLMWAPIALGAAGVTAVTRGTTAVVSSAVSASDKQKSKQAHEEKVGGFVESLKKGFKSAKSGIMDLFSED